MVEPVEKEVENLPIVRITEEGKSRSQDCVVREFPLTIVLNNQELATLLCSPQDLDYLAIGFLASEGLIKSRDEIEKTTVNEQVGAVHVVTKKDFSGELRLKRLITSGCGQGTSFYRPVAQEGLKIASNISLPAAKVWAMIKEFQQRSRVFQATGGVHSAALADSENIVLFKEDIGRHNAIDKIFGECLLKDISTRDRIIITSGRISSEILLKVAQREVPVLISKSAPTNLGVRLANDLGVTLIGFVRGSRMNIYANEWRVATDV